MLLNIKWILHTSECNLSSWVLKWTDCVLKYQQGWTPYMLTGLLENWKQLSSSKLTPVPYYAQKMVKCLFKNHTLNNKWKHTEVRPVIPRTNFGSHCSLTERKLPSINTFEDANVLLGPQWGHRRGRKSRHILVFLTGVKLGSKIVSLNIYLPSSVFSQNQGKSKPDKLCWFRG